MIADNGRKWATQMMPLVKPREIASLTHDLEANYTWESILNCVGIKIKADFGCGPSQKSGGQG